MKGHIVIKWKSVTILLLWKSRSLGYMEFFSFSLIFFKIYITHNHMHNLDLQPFLETVIFDSKENCNLAKIILGLTVCFQRNCSCFSSQTRASWWNLLIFHAQKGGKKAEYSIGPHSAAVQNTIPEKGK